MFDPTLTDEQEELIQTARRFAAEKIVPVAAKYDEAGEWPEEVFRQAWEVGLMNVEIPEALGGLGLQFCTGHLRGPHWRHTRDALCCVHAGGFHPSTA